MSKWSAIFRLAGIVGGAISCIALFRSGFRLELSSFLFGLVDFWDRFIRGAIGWLMPSVLDAIRAICGWFRFDIHIQLHSHWPHIFTLLQLYYGRDTVQFWELYKSSVTARRSAGSINGLLRITILSAFLGVLVALGSAIGAGLIDPASGLRRDQFFIALIPVGGFLVYALVMMFAGAYWSRQGLAEELHAPVQSFKAYLKERLMLTSCRVVIGVAVISLIVYCNLSRAPYLVALATAWVLLALEWLRRSIKRARLIVQKQHCSLFTALLQVGNFNLATNMLSIVGLAAIGILADSFVR